MRDWKICPWLVISILVLGVGCGGSAPPAATPSNAPEESSPVESPKLQPVAAPADLIAVGRLKSPALVVDVLSGWVNLPFDWRDNLRDLAGEIDKVVSFEAPIEAAVTLDPRPSSKPNLLFAASVGLVSFDGALEFLRASGKTPQRLPSGAYTVRLSEDAHCVVAHALGSSPARLVCSNKERGLDELAPYLALGLPNEGLSDNQFHVELRAEPLRRRYGKNTQMLKLGVPFVLRELSVDNPRFDAALSDSAYALADELIAVADDLESLSLDGSVDKAAEAFNLSLSLKLRGQRSWTGQWVSDSARRAGAAPEIFWSLPRDATLASYNVASDAARNEKLAAGVGELTLGALEYAGIPSRLRQGAASALQQIFLMEGPVVYAAGPAPGSAPGESNALLAAKAAFGYTLWAFDDEKGQIAELIRQWVVVYSDPAFAKLLKSKKVPLDTLPKVKSRRAPVASGLPAGSMVYEVVVPSKLAEKWLETDLKGTPSITVYCVIVQAGARAWVGSAANEQLIYAKLGAALKPQEGSTLVGREGLATLRSTQAVSAGFITLRYLLDQAGSFGSKGSPSSRSALSAKLPHHGDVPFVHRMVVSSDGPKTTWTISAPRAAFEDVASLILLTASSP